MAKVSVVMPVYNGEKYLREAIDSILAQTFTDWEFIIVNEYGSNAAATEILAEYAAKDQRIRVLQNREQLGIAESLNVGIRASKGKYIARMDGDDISGPDRLQRQVEYLDAHPDIGLLGIHPTIFGEEHWDWYTEYDPEQIKANALFFLPCLHPTVMIRKSVLEEHGLLYCPEYHCTEDYDLFERVLQYTKAGNLDDQELFHYRRYSTAATYAHADDGNEIYRKVMSRAFRRLSLSFSGEELSLLFIHEGCKKVAKKDLAETMLKLDLLLKQIFQKNLHARRFDSHALFRSLHKRWLHMWECDVHEKFSWKGIPQQIQDVYQHSIFTQDTFCAPFNVETGHTPRVTVLMPSYNGEKYIYETVKSLEDQNFHDWELLIINDPSTDDTVPVIQEYQKYDKRIRLIINETKAGLAEALNQGIRVAKGEYIARIDDDDIAMPWRLEKQVRLLDERPDVSLVGSWQRHFGREEWTHRPPETPEEMKAALLFKCDVCHSTIMFKKENFIKRGLYYSSDYVSEDYELWTRAIRELKFYTIQEVLGEYRVNGENITASKLDKLESQQRQIIARTLEKLLHLHVSQSDMVLLSGWVNPFFNGDGDKKQLREREEALLQKIERQNERYRAYNPVALKAVLDQRREWAGIIKPTKQSKEAMPKRTLKQRFKSFIKRLLKPFYHPFRWRYEDRLIRIENSVSQLAESVKNLQKTIYDVDGHLYDYYAYLTQSIQEQEAKIKCLQAGLSTVQTAVIAGADASIHEAESTLIAYLDDRVMKTERALTASTDARIWKAERALTASTDARIWKAERALTASTDARIWKAEQALTASTDARIWKAEQALIASTDTRIWKAEQALTASTDARIWKAELELKASRKKDLEYQVLSALADEKSRNKIFLIGTPEHSNIGDAAITVGEVEFFSRFFPEYHLIEITAEYISDWYEEIASMIRPSDMICLQGGGNLGNRYLHEEETRRKIIADFPNNPIVVLPQTVFFDDTDEGKQELALSQKIYCEHKHLTLLTRGEESRRYAGQYFPNAKVACVPDMALMLERDFAQERCGILLCMRAIDDESGLSETEYNHVLDTVRELDGKVEVVNNLYKNDKESRISKDIRWNVVRKELLRFASHRVVVTDRLHGLIFSMVTHTPCVVISSYNYKIAEFCESFAHSDSVLFLDRDLTNLSTSVEKLLENAPPAQTAVEPGQFEEISRLIVGE